MTIATAQVAGVSMCGTKLMLFSSPVNAILVLVGILGEYF